VFQGTKKKKDEVLVDSLNYNKKVLHSAWHPQENIIGKFYNFLKTFNIIILAVAATNNLYIFDAKNQ